MKALYLLVSFLVFNSRVFFFSPDTIGQNNVVGKIIFCKLDNDAMKLCDMLMSPKQLLEIRVKINHVSQMILIHAAINNRFCKVFHSIKLANAVDRQNSSYGDRSLHDITMY